MDVKYVSLEQIPKHDEVITRASEFNEESAQQSRHLCLYGIVVIPLPSLCCTCVCVY